MPNFTFVHIPYFDAAPKTCEEKKDEDTTKKKKQVYAVIGEKEARGTLI